MSSTPFVDIDHPANKLAMQWLKRHWRDQRQVTSEDEADDPYYNAGTHPDVVEFMWLQLHPGLPKEARCLVYGLPCLVHPNSGVIIAIGVGTEYVLRIPIESLPEAATSGCTPLHHWGGAAKDTNLEIELGPGWVFGSYGKESKRWCRATCDLFSVRRSASP